MGRGSESESERAISAMGGAAVLDYVSSHFASGSEGTVCARAPVLCPASPSLLGIRHMLDVHMLPDASIRAMIDGMMTGGMNLCLF